MAGPSDKVLRKRAKFKEKRREAHAAERNASPSTGNTDKTELHDNEATDRQHHTKRPNSSAPTDPSIPLSKTLAPLPDPPTPTPSDAQTPQDRPNPARTDFETWYLRAVTAQYAEDLDKLRNAPDFRDGFVPQLVDALRQGAGCFSREERELVMGRGGGG
ncbi:MAG: hypothetical protein M1828_003639 [Chrysothrix sp. TS-e1954]|nr:MAG: hypothetical protein M1828_003639 [Chrysothrix sp. TS-e1954]